MCVFVLLAGIVLLTVSCCKLDCELQINLFVTLWGACVGSQHAGKQPDSTLPYRSLRALGVKGLPYQWQKQVCLYCKLLVGPIHQQP